MWLQVIVEVIEILKLVLGALGLYQAPTTKTEE